MSKTANGRGRSHRGLILAVLVGIGAFSWIGPTYGPRLVDWIAGSSPKRPTAPPPPLTLSAAHDRGILSDGWIVVVPDRRRAAAAFASGIHDCDSLWRAARRAGAADLGTTYVHVTAEGSGPRTATIIGVRARVVARYPPASGALADCPGGGAVGVIRMRVELDSGNPVALRVVRIDHEDVGRVVGPFFADRAITVRRGESVPIVIEATSRDGLVLWNLEVTAIVNGRRRTSVLDDGGRPFRTTAHPSLELAHPDYEWNWDLRANRLEIHRQYPGLGY